mmetsp:Transcript_136409/g.423847  ORF Transcript_136409/g.423847 Transcript_136409/m.423847 type:complete len:314 (+) Transcript_136409:732-1673(+)
MVQRGPKHDTPCPRRRPTLQGQLQRPHRHSEAYQAARQQAEVREGRSAPVEHDDCEDGREDGKARARHCVDAHADVRAQGQRLLEHPALVRRHSDADGEKGDDPLEGQEPRGPLGPPRDAPDGGVQALVAVLAGDAAHHGHPPVQRLGVDVRQDAGLVLLARAAGHAALARAGPGQGVGEPHWHPHALGRVHLVHAPQARVQVRLVVGHGHHAAPVERAKALRKLREQGEPQEHQGHGEHPAVRVLDGLYAKLPLWEHAVGCDQVALGVRRLGPVRALPARRWDAVLRANRVGKEDEKSDEEHGGQALQGRPT